MEPLQEIKSLIDEQGRTWEEFKHKNDELIQAKAEGKAVAELTEQVEKINLGLTKTQGDLLEIAKKSNRPQIENQLSDAQLEHKSAFKKYLRKGDTNGLEEMQRKAMNTGTDSEGGYLVDEEMDAIIDRVVPTISAVYRLANVVTIGTARYEKLVKITGMTMARPGEGAGSGETTEPTYSKIAIDVFPAEVEPWVNNETLEDAVVNFEMDLAEEAAISFALGAGSEFITGNGVGKARGITSYTNIANASYAWGKIGYVATGKSAAFASVAPADKIVALQHALKAQYRPGAVYLMNDATLSTVRQMKDASGSYYLWNPDPTAGFGGRLLGSPCEIDDNMADVAALSYSVAFGNFARGYTIARRTGTTLIRDNLTTKGVTKFNFRQRFGAGVTNYEAIKLLKFATS